MYGKHSRSSVAGELELPGIVEIAGREHDHERIARRACRARRSRARRAAPASRSRGSTRRASSCERAQRLAEDRHEGEGQRALAHQPAQQVRDREGDEERVARGDRKRVGDQRCRAPGRARGWPASRRPRPRPSARRRRAASVDTAAPPGYLPAPSEVSMATHRSAKKRHVQSLKRRARNNQVRKTVPRRGAQAARRRGRGRGRQAGAAARTPSGCCARRRAKGVLHKRTVSRTVSRLAKLVRASACSSSSTEARAVPSRGRKRRGGAARRSRAQHKSRADGQDQALDRQPRSDRQPALERLVRAAHRVQAEAQPAQIEAARLLDELLRGERVDAQLASAPRPPRAAGSRARAAAGGSGWRARRAARAAPRPAR